MVPMSRLQVPAASHLLLQDLDQLPPQTWAVGALSPPPRARWKPPAHPAQEQENLLGTGASTRAVLLGTF